MCAETDTKVNDTTGCCHTRGGGGGGEDFARESEIELFDVIKVKSTTLTGREFWTTHCKAIPSHAEYIVIFIGMVKDYFKPLPGVTYCEMLDSHTDHLWSPMGNGARGTLWRKPSYTTQSGHFGGSEYNWPRDNGVRGDNRAHLSFWGQGDGQGGCCSTSLDSYDDGWNHPFVMKYGVVEKDDGDDDEEEEAGEEEKGDDDATATTTITSTTSINNTTITTSNTPVECQCPKDSFRNGATASDTVLCTKVIRVATTSAGEAPLSECTRPNPGDGLCPGDMSQCVNSNPIPTTGTVGFDGKGAKRTTPPPPTTSPPTTTAVGADNVGADGYGDTGSTVDTNSTRTSTITSTSWLSPSMPISTTAPTTLGTVLNFRQDFHSRMLLGFVIPNVLLGLKLGQACGQITCFSGVRLSYHSCCIFHPNTEGISTSPPPNNKQSVDALTTTLTSLAGDATDGRASAPAPTASNTRSRLSAGGTSRHWVDVSMFVWFVCKCKEVTM
jgi:hypothetical protein